MGVASGRQGKSYGIVTMALKKSYTDLRTNITYDEHFLTPTQTKTNFKDLCNYARCHPNLTLVVAYTMQVRSNSRLGPAHNTCGYNST